MNIYIGHQDKILSEAFKKPEGDKSGRQIFKFIFNTSDISQETMKIMDESAQSLGIWLEPKTFGKCLIIGINADDYNSLMDNIQPELLKLLRRKHGYLEQLLNVYSEYISYQTLDDMNNVRTWH